MTEVRPAIAALEDHLRDHPDDRRSWLVYADWLAEGGDPRAELVRHDRPTPRNDGAWRPDPLPTHIRLDWRHGFVVGAEVTWSDSGFDGVVAVLTHAETRLLTTLRIRFEEEEDDHDDPDEDEDWEGADARRARGLGRIGALPFDRVRTLDLAYARLSDDAVRALVVNPTLRGLTALDLRHNRVEDEGLAALAASPHLAGLRRLDLHDNRFGPDGVAALARSTHLTKLEVLDLRDNALGTAGALALAASPNLAALSVLHLYRADVGRDGAQALGASRTLPSDLRRTWTSWSSR